MKRIAHTVSFLCLTLLFVAGQTQARQDQKGLQVTTSSAEARGLFSQGLAEMEVLHWEAAMQKWRDAAQADPQFALAHILLAMLSRDPAEQLAERDKAVAARNSAGPEEQLIV